MTDLDPVADPMADCDACFMQKGVLVAVLALLAGGSQASAAEPQRTCLDLAKAQSQATLSGVLTVQLFAGPPNYESIARGDAEERAFILELPRRTCANDGEFIAPDAPFDRVQVSAADEAILGVLKAAIGRRVTVRGEAFGAHTGHHHAPLVLIANQLTVETTGR